MTDKRALQTRLAAPTRQHEVERKEAGNLLRLLSDLDRELGSPSRVDYAWADAALGL